MQKTTPTNGYDMAQLDEDTGRIITATTDALEEEIDIVQRRLAMVLNNAKQLASGVRDRAVHGAKYVDKTLHRHPYRAVGIAFAVSALIGFATARRCFKRD